MLRLSCFLFAVILCIQDGVKSEIPSYIHVCKRNDPHIEDCILSSIEKLRPKLVKGIPELEVPALEPLHLPEVVLTRGGKGTDVKVQGASNFKITKLKADVDNIVFNIGLTIPYLIFDAIYDVDLKILVIPIKGKGPITANATGIVGDIVLKGHKMKKDGEQYVVFDTLDLKLKVNNYSVRLDNLFNGDKNLGEAVNLALNDNKKELMKTVIPVAEKVVADVLLDIGNKITTHFPYKDLFPKE